MELFSPSVRNRCNRIFCFDRAQYETFFDENPQGFFHLPLGTDWRRSEKAIREAAKEKKSEYRGDIAFVGSLYTEKNPYRMIRGISDRSRGYIDGICNCAIQVYGANIIESLVTDEIADELEPLIPDMQLPIVRDNAKARRYMIVNEFINMEASVREREGILRSLAEHFELDLYTNSKVSSLGKVHCHPAVKTFTEMPVVFHESRINLNITMRSITSGIPMRVFDICGCGGFCLTNWQEELPELYEPGVEIESYASEEELIDKADFYLRNETARARIAQNGWKRTQESHTCEARVAEMIRILSDTFGGDTGRV